jgi:hypothetical protein
MDDHPIMQPGDGAATGAHEEPGYDRMDEAGQGSEEERASESESAALMLQIRLSHGARVLEE